jgi:hypothetical protein
MSRVENEAIQGVQGETPLESNEKSPEQAQYDHEKQAFETHVNTSPDGVPENFSDAGAWFDSLKEAQKQYTQSRQEISELRAQVEQQPAVNTPVTEEAIDSISELRITPPEVVPEMDPGTATAQHGVDDATYEMWALEFAAQGQFSEGTREEIKTRTGFTDRMLEDYVAGQNAKLRESYRQAATVVGGNEKMAKIFDWAATNLSPEEMQSVNIGLSSSTYEVTLRGLSSMYDNAVKAEKVREPAPNPNLQAIPSSEMGIQPYQTKREFTAERNDPKYGLEPTYRDMVQRRMTVTDWNMLRP